MMPSNTDLPIAGLTVDIKKQESGSRKKPYS